MTFRLRLRKVNHVEPEKTKGTPDAEAVVEGAQALGGSEDHCGHCGLEPAGGELPVMDVEGEGKEAFSLAAGRAVLSMA